MSEDVRGGRMSLVRAALGNVGSTLASTALLLLTGILTARVLGPEGKGNYAFAMLVPHLAVNVSMLGLTTALVFFVARDRRQAGSALGTSLAVVLAVAGTCTGALLLLARSLNSGNSPTALLSVTAWAIPALAGYGLCRHALLGLERMSGVYVLNALDKAILLALLLAATLAGRGALANFCLLYSISAGVGFALALALTLPALGGRLRVSRSYAGSSLRYGLRSHLGWLAEILNYRLDMLIVQLLGGAVTLGFYSVAVSIAETLWLIPNCVSVVLLPHLVARGAKGSVSTPLVCRALLLMSLLGGVGLAVLGLPLVVGLYGQAFEPAFAPLALLLPGVALYSIVRPLGADFAARGKPGLASAAAGVSLLLTVVLDVSLIPAFGAEGAAAASTLAYAARAVLMVYLYTRLAGVPARAVLLPRLGDAGTIWSSLVRALRRPSSPPTPAVAEELP